LISPEWGADAIKAAALLPFEDPLKALLAYVVIRALRVLEKVVNVWVYEKREAVRKRKLDSERSPPGPKDGPGMDDDQEV